MVMMHIAVYGPVNIWSATNVFKIISIIWKQKFVTLHPELSINVKFNCELNNYNYHIVIFIIIVNDYS